MNSEPKNITLPEPPTGHVWQYRGMGWRSKKPVIYACEGRLGNVSCCDVPEFTRGLEYLRYWEAVVMSATPRTDAARSSFVDFVAFSEQLETELNHMTAAAETYLTELDAAKGIAEALEEEHAELKSTLKEVRKAAQTEINVHQNILGRYDDEVDRFRSECIKLQNEVAELKSWKAEALGECTKWNPQTVGKELGMSLGEDILPNILPKIRDLKALASRREELMYQYESERDNWRGAAAEAQRGADYYRNLLVECGEAIGKEAYTCDDGTTQSEVLVAKVPELVRTLVAYVKDREGQVVHMDNLLDAADIPFQDFGCTPISTKTEPAAAYPVVGDILRSKVYGWEKRVESISQFAFNLERGEQVQKICWMESWEIVTPEIDHTEGGKYRMLEVGENVRNGDEHLDPIEGWRAVYFEGGRVSEDHSVKYRRPVQIATPVENPEDFARQAKDLLNRLFSNTHNSDPFVDNIIQAAKQ